MPLCPNCNVEMKNIPSKNGKYLLVEYQGAVDNPVSGTIVELAVCSKCGHLDLHVDPTVLRSES